MFILNISTSSFFIKCSNKSSGPANSGKLIPAGIGARKYRNANYTLEHENLQEEPLEALEQQLLD